MTIKDKIYGNWEIKDPLVIELLQTDAVQRIGKIANDGANRFLYETGNPTRLEHSLGVLYLTQRYSTNRVYHVMALLHDIAHTAFSHVVDFVKDNTETQKYHEKVIHKIVDNSQIPEVLKKYGFDVSKFYDKESLPMIGAKMPDVNTDRIDYFLRDGFGINAIDKNQIQLYLEDLHFDVEKELFYFDDPRIAGSFALACLNTSIFDYSSPNGVGGNYLLAQALKVALDEKIITDEDFLLTDDVVLEKIKKSNNTRINQFLERLNRKVEFEFCSKEGAEYTTLVRFRNVDPFFKDDKGKLIRVSESISNYKEVISFYKNNLGEISIKEKK